MASGSAAEYEALPIQTAAETKMMSVDEAAEALFADIKADSKKEAMVRAILRQSGLDGSYSVGAEILNSVYSASAHKGGVCSDNEDVLYAILDKTLGPLGIVVWESQKDGESSSARFVKAVGEKAKVIYADLLVLEEKKNKK
jgi:hypothetical protein